MYNSAIALLKGIKGEFSSLLQTMPNSSFDKVITRVKSNSNEEKYRIPESMPRIKEWIDQRHYGDLSDKFMTVVNKSWDNGLLVDRDTLDDSREYLGGDVEAWVRTLVDTYKSFPDEAVQAILDANTTAFDGTALFATSRPNLDTGSNTIYNLVSGTSSTTYSLSEFQTDYKSAKSYLFGQKDKNNKAFNKGAKLAVIVPAHLEDVARNLLVTTQQLIYVSGTISNQYALDNTEIIVNWEQSSSDNDWYLVNLGASFKPFLIQDRKGPQWMYKDDPEYKDIKYGFDFRMGYAPLNPMAIVKVNN